MKQRGARFTVLGVLAVLALASVAVPTSSSSAAAAEIVDLTSTTTKTITREHLVNGAEVVAETRKVTLTVSQTENLRSRQSIGVTWQGAHPTGNVVPDVNSPTAISGEFPFILMQCRGVDSTRVPEAERLSPQTCWTQTAPQERVSQAQNTNFPAWRVDRYAESADRTFHVNDPSPLPTGCDAYPTYAQYRVPFVSAQGTTYYPDGASCTKGPPEGLVVDNASQPGNTTYGITRPDGKGETKFTVWTKQDNGSLGCAQEVACALVAIPVLGVSCDVSAAALPLADRPLASEVATAAKDCESNGNYLPGETFNGNAPALSVSGKLWWTASNWRNRITVPLTFAPADNACDIVGAKDGVDLYGSELMAQATTQWRPTFCLDAARTPFRHVQTGEPLAVNFLKRGTIEASLVTHRPESGYARPVVSAPVAFTGFAISYVIDDAQGAALRQLRLTPRLIAKLLTMSYPGEPFVQKEYAALRNNPLNLSLDPEFQALNPGIKKGVNATVPASTMLSLSSDSDVIRSLTAYISADQEARAWLDGAADPWGMTVNPSYRSIALPVQTWPQLDTFQPKEYYAITSNACLRTGPVPFLPLIATPTSRLSSISFAMQFANSTSQVNCIEPVFGSTVGLKLVGAGPQSPGFRFVLGLTSLGDVARFNLDTAALQTVVAPGTEPKFTNDTGRTFVAPTDNALRAAANLLTPNAEAGVWDLPIASIVSDDAAKAAYPGAMVVYAAVPTAGLPAAAATAYAALVEWAVTTGQTPGTRSGTLPPGYLPLTAANGLGALASYSSRAAVAIADQKGVVPPLFPVSAPPASSAPPESSAPTASAGGSTSSTVAPRVAPAPTATPLPTKSGAPAKGPVPTQSPEATLSPKPSASATAAVASSGTSAPSSRAVTNGSSVNIRPDAIAAPASIVPPPAVVKALPSPQIVSAVQPPQRVPTPAQVLGRLGSLAPVLILVAFGLGGLVPLALTVRQVRGRRG